MHQAIVGSRLVVLEKASHVSNIEQSEQFNQELERFLREIDD
jgi:pimeloyl-ACP methyl ester carboxylesterase